MFQRSSPTVFRSPGFTLIEMMVAMTVLLLILGVIFKITQGTADTWKNSTGKTEGFRDARGAFEAMTRAISQATLNTYFDYVNNETPPKFRDQTPVAANFVPFKYARRSDLHFICGKELLKDSVIQNPVSHAIFFQAPLGYSNSSNFKNMESLLNACGFFVHYGQDIFKPGFLGTTSAPVRNRYRLMQFVQPSESFSLYDSTITGGSASWNNKLWFFNPIALDVAPSAKPVSLSQLGENVIALVVLPTYSRSDQKATPSDVLSTDYEYDSRTADLTKAKYVHQLPPVVRVAMVVIDEGSAIKLGNTATPPNLGVATLFKDPTKLAADLEALGSNLSALPGNAAGNTLALRYEVFQSDVSIRGSKWSTK